MSLFCLKVRYDIQDIYSCNVMNEDRHAGSNCVFRITRVTKEGFKNMDFEAPYNVASELGLI